MAKKGKKYSNVVNEKVEELEGVSNAKIDSVHSRISEMRDRVGKDLTKTIINQKEGCARIFVSFRFVFSGQFPL